MKTTRMTSAEHIKLTEKYVVQTYEPQPFVYSRGRGVWVWNPEGKKCMEMLSCYSALGLGHPAHPKILRAFVEQAKKVGFGSCAFYNEQEGHFAKELAEFCQMAKVLPMNSGAEAVERAIKIARKWGYTVKGIPKYKAEIIGCHIGFHGRTLGALSIAAEPAYIEFFKPLPPGFVQIPYGDSEALEKAINENTCAFIVEPIQGEGGIIVPPEGYLKGVEEICQKHNVLFVVDEIQTGLGRSGKRFAYEYENVKPDILILGKLLGGGLAKISAAVCSEKVADVLKPPDDGSTFCRQPESLAAAREALKLIIEEKLAENAFEMGNYFLSELKKIKSPFVEEVRGRGLMIAVKFWPEADGSGRARKFAGRLLEEGLLCKETHKHFIRFLPPLIIKKKEVDWALKRIKKVLTPHLNK